MKIGFIGLGDMGGPMVGHLLAAGHSVTVWSRRPPDTAATARWLEQGAHWADNPTELARHSEIVCTNVTGGADVAGLAEALIPGLSPGSLHVDFSTIAPSTARELALRYAERGLHFVDAPVSGGSAGARAASLVIMWGGDPALAGRLEPLFCCIGKTAVHVGPTGAGQVAKVCNQIVMVTAIEATAEAARLAGAAGIDFTLIREAMQGGAAGSRVLDFFGGKMASRDFTAGVEARLHHKDFAMALAEAAAAGIPLPVASATMQQLNALMAAGWGSEDTSRLLCVLERSRP